MMDGRDEQLKAWSEKIRKLLLEGELLKEERREHAIEVMFSGEDAEWAYALAAEWDGAE